MYKRPAISELFLMALKRFVIASGYECKLITIISESESFYNTLMYKKGGLIVSHNNFPLSNKWNYGIEKALTLGWDYLFLTDDDDFYNHELWEVYKPHIEAKADYIGLRSNYFYDLPTGEAVSFRFPMERMTGCGRMLSRKLVEDCFPLMESGLNSGLNNNMDERILAKGYKRTLIDYKYPLALDIKCKQNIWQINNYQAFSANAIPEILNDFLNEDELKFLERINNEGCLKQVHSI